MGGGPLRSLLSSAAMHGVVLGAGALLGLHTAVRAALQPSAPAPSRVATIRPVDAALLKPDEREDELEELPTTDALPEPELVPLNEELEPTVWPEEHHEALPESTPDLKAWTRFEPRPEPPVEEPPLDVVEDAEAEAEAEPASEPAPAAEPKQPVTSGPVVVGPVPVHQPAASYPRMSQRLGEEGVVLCLLDVDARGAVTAVTVEESSGHARLDDAARKQLAQWRFEPGTVDGAPAASTYRHRVRFSLRG